MKNRVKNAQKSTKIYKDLQKLRKTVSICVNLCQKMKGKSVYSCVFVVASEKTNPISPPGTQGSQRKKSYQSWKDGKTRSIISAASAISAVNEKQSQFGGCRNECKTLYYKKLCQYHRLWRAKKQTQLAGRGPEIRSTNL